MVTKPEVIEQVLNELNINSRKIRKLVASQYDKLKNNYSDDDLVWAIIESLST